MVRGLLIIGGSVALLIALLVYGFLAGLFPQSVRDAAVQAVVRYVSTSLPGTLEVGTVRGSFLSGPVIQNIVLKDTHGAIIGQKDRDRHAQPIGLQGIAQCHRYAVGSGDDRVRPGNRAFVAVLFHRQAPLEATRGQLEIRYKEVEPWAWARLSQRLRAIRTKKQKLKPAAAA